MNEADLPHLVIGACMNVHHHLGPGLTREAYEECLAIELRDMELTFERGKALDFLYRNRPVKSAARMDFVVDGQLLLQIVSVTEVTDLDKQRIETLLRLSHIKVGLLVNFNVTVLRKGIHRIGLKRRKEESAGVEN